MDDGALETTGYFEGPHGWLYGCRHAAPAGSAAAGLVLAPFGEERKCAYRFLVEVSRVLAPRLTVMRFDFSGTGESTGSHAEATLARWLADARAALAHLRAAAPAAKHCWLLGARLGANLALRVAAAEPAVTGLVLWAPLLTGGDCLDELIRRRQIKAMMGGGQNTAAADDLPRQWAGGAVADCDGFAVNATLAAELRALDLDQDLRQASQQSILLAHVTGARTLSAPWAALAASFAAVAGRRFVVIRQKPFWGLLEYQEAKELHDETMAFVSSAAG